MVSTLVIMGVNSRFLCWTPQNQLQLMVKETVFICNTKMEVPGKLLHNLTKITTDEKALHKLGGFCSSIIIINYN
jgi:hypothetical protein